MGGGVSKVISKVSWEIQTAKRVKLRAQLASCEGYTRRYCEATKGAMRSVGSLEDRVI